MGIPVDHFHTDCVRFVWCALGKFVGEEERTKSESILWDDDFGTGVLQTNSFDHSLIISQSQQHRVLCWLMLQKFRTQH